MSKTSQKLSELTDGNSARIDGLFVRFSAIYGHIWQSQFKDIDFLDVVKIEWDNTLKIITDENIEKALNECRKHFDMPPTLPAFYQLCISFQPIKPSNYFKPYETKVADPSIAEANLKK